MMKKLKQVMIVMIAVGFLASCRKDITSAGIQDKQELLLSRKYTGNELEAEYIYSLGRDLVRKNFYTNMNGQPVIHRYTIYEYNNENKIGEARLYMSNAQLNNLNIFTYGNNNKVIRSDYYTQAGLSLIYLFHYNSLNQLVKISEINPVMFQTVNYREYSYDGLGRLQSERLYNLYNNQFKLNIELRYQEQTDPSVYKHWNIFQHYPTDFFVQEMTAGKIQHFSYDLNGNMEGHSIRTYSNRQYNTAGLLVQQTLTVKFTLPAMPDEVVTEKFEYVE